MNTTSQPNPLANRATIHSSQHMRVVTNTSPDIGRVLTSSVTTLEMTWVAGELRLRFTMRETRLLPGSETRQPGARSSARNMRRL